jgi:hypothetical protein
MEDAAMREAENSVRPSLQSGGDDAIRKLTNDTEAPNRPDQPRRTVRFLDKQPLIPSRSLLGSRADAARPLLRTFEPDFLFSISQPRIAPFGQSRGATALVWLPYLGFNRQMTGRYPVT